MDTDNLQHELTIRNWEINEDRLKSMQDKLFNTPKLMSLASGLGTCSIFKVPQTLIDLNGKSYQPHILSIGPIHHGQQHLQMIEEHKWRLLRQLLDRIKTQGVVLEDMLKAVHPLEATARECYSETITYTTHEFIEMMVLDACFIIELFRNSERVVKFDKDDPLITKLWIDCYLLRDLIMLENQIPFFVLECLFDLTKMSSDHQSNSTLASLALKYFNRSLQRPEDVISKYYNFKPLHLLDLLRSSLLPPQVLEHSKPGSTLPPHIIHPISKLRRAGIKIKPSNADSFLVVNFKHGVIHMPTISIDDFMSAFLLNSVAFEQCHSGCSKHFTTYVTLLDCLINTSRDVGYLCDWNIIENNLASEDEVTALINNMGKDISFDIDACYLADLFNDVNRHYRSDWHVHLASFKYTYFNTPWSFISAFAAFILLVLTVTQTVYTVLGYVRPR